MSFLGVKFDFDAEVEIPTGESAGISIIDKRSIKNFDYLPISAKKLET